MTETAPFRTDDPYEVTPASSLALPTVTYCTENEGTPSLQHHNIKAPKLDQDTLDSSSETWSFLRLERPVVRAL